jgi:acyl dehydratase
MGATEQSSVSLEPGVELAARMLGPVTETDFVRFAGASGDFNPLHYDERFVAEAGYPGLFAMGLLPCGVLAGYLAAAVGHSNVRSFGVRFTAVVYAGDTLTLSGRVEAIEAVGDAREARLSLAVTRQTGEAALVGSATVLAS